MRGSISLGHAAARRSGHGQEAVPAPRPALLGKARPLRPAIRCFADSRRPGTPPGGAPQNAGADDAETLIASGRSGTLQSPGRIQLAAPQSS